MPTDKQESQRQINERYDGYRRQIYPDEYRCPQKNGADEWQNWVNLQYCESFCFGEGCSKKDKCQPYLKKKYENKGESHESERTDENGSNDESQVISW